MATETTNKNLRDYRIERYEELGFTPKEASELAEAKTPNGLALYWGDVRKMLDAGCGHKLAVKTLT